MEATELVRDIARARHAFAETVAALDDLTVERPIAPGRWSPLEYLEHLVRAEDATVWRMFGAVEELRAGVSPPEGVRAGEPIEKIVENSWGPSEDAPPLAVPTLRGSATYWLARLDAQQAVVSRFADSLRGDELDGAAYLHPISGPFTMRQGLEFIRFHLDRHRAHIEGVETGDP